MKLTTTLLISALLFSSSSFAVINVSKLNSELIKQHATWTAGENQLTGLSKQELKRRLGLMKAPTADAEFSAPQTANLMLPASIDWRNKDGKNWVSPILDQANCGSCVAFASIGVLETQYKISSALPTFNIKLSPQHLFSCGGGACDSGWYPSMAARFLMTKGVPDEACMPYTSGATGEDVACKQSCSDATKRSIKIAQYATPSRDMKDLNSVKQALQRGPVMTTLSVYSDFVSYAGGVYRHTTGEMLGGHAISIVGYDDSKQAFIIRNSWGETWGEKGFGYVAYDDSSGVGGQTWGFQMPSMAGAVSILSPTDYSYFTTEALFNVVSTNANTDSINVSVYNLNNQVVAAGTCKGTECKQNIDLSKLADGKYEVQAQAIAANGSLLTTSTRQFFYWVNKAPTISITYTGKDVDLSKPVKDRIEFDVTTTTTSVPMSSIVFNYSGIGGKGTREASVVLPKMSTGWRTPTVPNGQYEVWFTGHVKSNNMDVVVESARTTVTVKN